MSIKETAPKSRAAWRAWLEKHHRSAAEIQLVLFKQRSSRANLTYNDAVEEALCFGWIDGVRRSRDDESYTHRFSPRKPGSNWSALNKQRAERMLEAGLMRPAGRAMIEDAKASGQWANPHQPPKQFEAPAEFKAALGRNKKAGEFFAALAPSYQRQYVAWIATAKRPETRAKRVAEAVKLLAAGEKLGMR